MEELIIEWSRLPLSSPYLCQSGVKHLVVGLGLLLVSRARSWEEELEVEQRGLRIYSNLLDIFVTIHCCMQDYVLQRTVAAASHLFSKSHACFSVDPLFPGMIQG